MDKWDFSDLENKINNSVNNTFNTIDNIVIKAEEFKDSIINSTNVVTNNIKNNTRDLNEKLEKKKREQMNKMNDKHESEGKWQWSSRMQSGDEKKNNNNLKPYVAKRAPGSISGIFLVALGSFLTAIFGVSIVSYSIFTSFKSAFSIFNMISIGILVSLLGISIGTIIKGTNLRSRAKRFKEYVKCLNGHEYGSIEKFANSVGKKKKFVVKDLKKMIDAGLFKEANMDEEENYLILGNQVYEDYLMAKKSFEQRKEEQIRRNTEYQESASDQEKTQLMETVDLCRGYIDEIQEANISITDTEFSSKLDRLEKVVSEILNCIEKNPNKLGEVNKFTNHYLPITLKLVNSYKELSRQEVQGENIRNAKTEIESSIDVINKAFENLLDDLFEDMALDISTDISVLKTLFTQDGLTKKDFEK